MLKVSAEKYIFLGQCLHKIRMKLYELGSAEDPLKGGDLRFLVGVLNVLKGHCASLELKISSRLIQKEIKSLSNKSGVNAAMEQGVINTLMDTVIEEMQGHLFLYVPLDRSDYYEWGDAFKEQFVESFPNASKELIRAGKCYTVGEFTACVFHSMRAAEIGLRALAGYLDIDFKFPIDLAGWQDLITSIDTKIKSRKQDPKTIERDEDLKFCSEAASQFRYFKDGYRIFVAHARGSYEEEKALSIT